MSLISEELAPVTIFNHLDINIIVHETRLSKHSGTYKEGGETKRIDVAGTGHSWNVHIPEKTVRIVGFEVTPRSVP